MIFDVKIEGNRGIVEVQGELLRINDCLLVSQDLNRLIDAGFSEILLDLDRVTSVCASFCGFLVSVNQKAAESRAKFSLVMKEDSEAYEMLSAVNIQEIMDIYPSVEHIA